MVVVVVVVVVFLFDENGNIQRFDGCFLTLRDKSL